MKAQLLQITKKGLYARLVFQAPAIARLAQPGQFVEVKIEGPQAPFWRRPFSICRVKGGTLELLIKTLGQGTRLLCDLKSGEEVDLIGPLGKGFTLPAPGPVWLVGGGFGVAPLLFLAERLKRPGRKVEVLIGGQCQTDLLLRPEFKRAGASVVCTTEDGSAGMRGKITLLLEKRLRLAKKKPLMAAAGPQAMLAAVAKLAAAYQVKAEVCLEELMACGLGVCNGCVVKANGVYQRVCKDGPVFPAEEVAWEG